jgi:N-acetylglucosamine repressor
MGIDICKKTAILNFVSPMDLQNQSILLFMATPMQKATRQHTKEHNRNLVLKTIFERDSISRAEIARVTSLTRTTVSDIVADLLEEGLVSEIGVGSSLGGKSPILLSLVDDSRYLIGLDLARNQFRGAIVNLRGKIRETVTLPVNSNNGDEALALVYEILDQLMKASCLPLVGIGIGTPGLVNITEGIVINAVNLDWKDLPLARLMGERYHLPVYILNDSQAAAMGEYTYGKGHPSDSNLIVINARHGIGSGIIINGRLFQGDGGGAGEIGHVVVVPDGGQLCRCGNRGCLETVASTQALIKRVQLLVSQSSSNQLLQSPNEITLDTIEQAFSSGDPLAYQAVLETGRYMGMAISTLVGTLNIQKIVLTGDMTRFGSPWLEAIRGMLTELTLFRLAQETQIEIGQLAGNDVILGASAMLANNYSLLFKSQPSRG